MPSRQRIKHLPTPDLQGGDSWVKIAAITVGEAQKLREETMIPDSNGDLSDQQRLNLETQVKETHLKKMLAELVLDWNWVDDAGAPLPKPLNNPEVFNLLTTAELLFLSESIVGFPAEAAKKKLR